MKIIELIAICHFGMESIAKKEIEELGYDVVEVRDGRVIFEADFDGVCRANLSLRTVERIMIKLGEFKATTFEELFDQVYRIRFEQYIPKDGIFPVEKAVSVRSKLFSTRDIQSITKKAISKRLGTFYGQNILEETGVYYPIRVNILKDIVTIALDTTGESLHKRGYRTYVSKAPLSETLAASIINLTPYNRDRYLIDPFCGSGTIPIEAAMMAKNIAPGLKRKFTAMKWNNLISKKMWDLIIEEAYDEILDTKDINIQGYDIDFRILKGARANAKKAGVDDIIHFQERPIKDFSSSNKYGFVISNPPYGIRLENDFQVDKIYQDIGRAIKNNPTWSFYLISAYKDILNKIGKKEDKNRKIYNGMLKSYLYSYLGEKPKKKNYERNNISNTK